MKRFKITVAGTGYVGLSVATLLSVQNDVTAIDVITEKVDMINNRQSPIKDEYIEKFFAEKELSLYATMDADEAYRESELIFIAVPTNYDDERGFFDTHCIEDVLDKVVECNSEANIVIKSTIPIGYTQSLRERYGTNRIYFSPEFLREGRALEDNLFPSRIIIGCDKSNADEMKFSYQYCELMAKASHKDEVKQLVVGLPEAECIKLFANSYMAMRVAYFNELDSYCEVKGYNTKDVLNGVCAEPRIGEGYNNPSFGYGGYCFPKDTKQLLANFKDQKYPSIPYNLVEAIVESNWERKMFIMNQIQKPTPQVIGIYRLTMKTGSDNFRSSAIFDIMKGLSTYNQIIVYEPTLNTDEYNGYSVLNNLEEFKSKCDVIVANRFDDCLEDVKSKVYTRDIFNNN